MKAIKSRKSGKLITFEGAEGSGKTTQIKLLKNYFENQGLNCVVSREPGGTRLGEEIRKILLVSHNFNMTPYTELFLFLASRAQHVNEVIIPSLNDGKIVILDRYIDSSVAYQGYGREIGGDIVKELNNYAIFGMHPDITFILDYPIDKGIKRSLKRLGDEVSKEDRMERESLLFHNKIRTGYLELSKREPKRIIILDGVSDPKKIHEKIVKVIEKKIP